MASAERAIESAVVKLGHLLVSEIKFLSEVHGDVYWMQSELRWMSCFLEDADAKGKNGDKRTQNWIREVTNIAQEAEDVTDTFMLQIERKRRQKSSVLKRHACIPSELVDLHYIGTAILQIRSKIHSISESRERYGISNLGDSSGSTEVKLRAQRSINPHLPRNKHIVGFEGEEKRILKLLLNSEAKKLVVVPLVGMGGLGKTTLATMIYNNNLVKDWFTYRAWVTVSEEFKPIELLHNLIRQVGGNPKESNNMEDTYELKSDLHKCLKGKKYIIVLDDIWEQYVWQQLKDAFPDEDGSRVLITTRFIDVAKSANPNNEPYMLPYLDHKSSWKLFLNLVFPSEDGSEPKCPEELITSGEELVQKCGGLPMGVKMLGGLLSVTDRTIQAWNKVAVKWKYQDSDLWILALSYNRLPNANMKSCFLYIGNYPEDYIIKASEITKIWIAEGFIPNELNQTFEETAKDYLDQFVLRCMVQVVDRTKTSKRVKHFRIHDLFRKWCISEAQEDGFFRICTSSSDTSEPGIISARRLTVYESIIDDKFCDFPYNARAILGFNYLSAGNFLSGNIGHNFKFLRVIYLNFPKNVKIHKSKSLKEISRLIHLRNITLISEALKYLPSSIGKLHNLQTLNIKNTSILKLPKTIYKIDSLRHIYTRGITFGSSVIWKSRNLQTLDSISGGSWMLKNFTRLLNLRKLSVFGITKNGVRGLQDSLHKLNHLKSLCLESGGQPYPSLFTSFKSHNPLLKLTLINWSNIKSNFPQNLISIRLNGCTFEKGMISSLEKLSGLANLNLEDCDVHSEDEFVFTSNGFRQLENLHISEMRSLLDWRIEKGALPKIKYLMLKATDWLQALPNGLEHLDSLQKLEMELKGDLTKRLLETLGDRHKIPQIAYVTLNGIQLDQHKRAMHDNRMGVGGDEPILSIQDDKPTLSTQNDERVLCFQDDAPVLSTKVDGQERSCPDDSESSILIGRTMQKIIYKTEAPLSRIGFKVLLQVKGLGADFNSDRPGVDIVTLVGGGFKGIERMKLAMKFLIQKLNPIDRLSVISFSEAWQLLCPLRQLTKDSQVEIENLVDGLIFGRDVDVNKGLEIGLQVLNDRRFTTGRKAAIYLMVDRNAKEDLYALPQPMNVPVHTFTFGIHCDPRLVKDISGESMGGVFSHIEEKDGFIIPFSRSLGKLLTVAHTNLKLTVRQNKSTINSVNAGNYPQSTDHDGSVTVSFGDLYVGQLCNVLVDLELSIAAGSRPLERVVEFSTSYRSDELELVHHPPIFASVHRR